jgi:hypothetical protein
MRADPFYLLTGILHCFFFKQLLKRKSSHLSGQFSVQVLVLLIQTLAAVVPAVVYKHELLLGQFEASVQAKVFASLCYQGLLFKKVSVWEFRFILPFATESFASFSILYTEKYKTWIGFTFGTCSGLIRDFF